MTKKIKTAVFSVSFWKDEKHPNYESWKKCVDKNIDYDYIFTCPGSYSDPKIMENEIDVIQIDLKNTEEYHRDWNYWRVGFLNGLYHLMLNIKDFDIAIHVQDTALFNIDLNPIVEEFYQRDEILAAPQYLSEGGLMVETAFMMLKKEAVQQYITSPLRPSLSKEEVLNVEEEAFYMFENKWWNFIPEVISIRKNDFLVEDDEKSPFTYNDEEFNKLPIISTSRSFTLPEHIENWKKYNKI